MADIFISYSSKDREKAEQLSELLASAGLSVWIDKVGIGAATSWSKEIVQAIDSCKALVVLLSPYSVASVNVAKEVSLAAEQKKKILPLDLEPVELSDDLRYHLAGIQRAPMTNIDSIIRALGKLGLEATQAPTMKLVKETDSRKSLMILPFEDLSPTADNGWFADGIVSELIGTLSNIKSLRLMDQQETKSFKNFKGHLTEYARTMDIRYFVQGSVRKFGDQIKIMSQLLDIQNGEYVWQDTHKGTMSDIFEIQEAVAQKVVEGLTLHLSSDEKKKLAERGTENTEAYELYLKATEYYQLQTKEGFEIASQLCSQATRLDPSYALAYSQSANIETSLFRSYDRDPERLKKAEALCQKALKLKPDLYEVYYPLMMTYMLQQRLPEAEDAAKEHIRKDSENSQGYFSLGFFYQNTGNGAKAVAPLEEGLRIKPDHLVGLFNLVLSCEGAEDKEKSMYWSTKALPLEERRLRLQPDDDSSRMRYSYLLFYAGKHDEARLETEKLKHARDGFPLFNTAVLLVQLGQKKEAILTFCKAMEAGYKNVRQLRSFLNDEDIISLAATAEYQEAERIAKEIEKEVESKQVRE
jgi:TolB-like protein